ncbi:MAG: 50S ribosomal protein L20 [Syntrophomonadaceae bacterium]|nr:50S ribosomal protein L20 [Bacillota bacterium]
MPRVKRGVAGRARHKKIIKLTKGYFGAKSKLFRTANQAMLKSLANAYRDRRNLKRDYRQLWIARINAAARMNGMSYSRLISGLKRAGVDINRKMLADLAVNDTEGFSELVGVARKSQ